VRLTAIVLILLAGCASPEPPAPQRAFPPEEARAQLEKLLLENIVPFWYPGVIDEEHGGYRLNHDHQGTWLGPADKALVTQARTAWFFARLHNSPYGRPEHLDAARHGFRFLKERMWDPEHGGFYWSVSNDGSAAVEDRKHLYGQGFALYALAEYVRATGDPEAVDLAGRQFALLEEKAHDDEHGGYLEVFPRDWSRELPERPRESSTVSRGQARDQKLMNTHLHLMEPFTTYYEVTGDELVGERLRELVLVLSNAVVRKDLGACTDRYERDWTPVLEGDHRRVSYGHDIENVWLLMEAADALGTPNGPLTDLYQTLFDYSLEFGWDEQRGGFFYTGPFEQPSDDRVKSWWVQAEGLISALRMHQLTGDQKYYEVFERTLQWILDEQADWEHGDWHQWIRDGRALEMSKSGAWKSPYHNGRAVLECLEVLGGDAPA
jgi:mannobiose 2-epimerase